jgi:hypothetical protein
MLTIVAAAGTDANAGLPGISPGLREPQRIFRVQGLQLTLQPDPLATTLNHSCWSTRAWTMQEGLLSHRKLVFTYNQVYFSCEHGNCSEGLNSPIRIHEPVKSVFQTDPYNLNILGKTNWEIYKSIVSDYTKRSLSYESDIFNAFKAISEVLKREIFGERQFLASIPLCILAYWT